MAIQFEKNEAFLIIHVSEVFKQIEFEQIKKYVAELVVTQKNINMLLMFDEGFISLEEGMDWSDSPEDEDLQKQINKIAIIGDLKWKERALLFLLDGLVPVTIEYFPIEQEELARAWLS